MYKLDVHIPTFTFCLGICLSIVLHLSVYLTITDSIYKPTFCLCICLPHVNTCINKAKFCMCLFNYLWYWYIIFLPTFCLHMSASSSIYRPTFCLCIFLPLVFIYRPTFCLCTCLPLVL